LTNVNRYLLEYCERGVAPLYRKPARKPPVLIGG
jgi:hypothetical protein